MRPDERTPSDVRFDAWPADEGSAVGHGGPIDQLPPITVNEPPSDAFTVTGGGFIGAVSDVLGETLSAVASRVEPLAKQAGGNRGRVRPPLGQ